MTAMTDPSFLNGPADQAARRLLGCELLRRFDTSDGRSATLRVRIVETEAYDQADAASHSYKGRTPRTDIMFGSPGFLYVYFTYGMHYCCNVVTGPEGHGAAVLLRAAEPLAGIDIMAANRHRPAATGTGLGLTDGPAKLCQALGIGKSMNGHDLARPPLQLVVRPPLPPDIVGRSPRVGISKAKDVPWRFYIVGNTWISKRCVS